MGTVKQPRVHYSRQMRVFLSLSVVASMYTFCLPQLTYGIDLTLGDSELKGSLDTTVSIGVSVRVEDRDQDIIGRANGGTANSINGDNGNLNYDDGDIFSAPAKILQELDLTYKDVGAFVRWSYIYDYAIMDEDTEFRQLSDRAEDEIGNDFQWLDYYLTGSIELSGANITYRLGSQVINWGESTFIQNGLNTINPIIVSKIRVAGAELREALEPVRALDLNFGLSDSTSLEAFYLFEWEHTELEPAGTYFSTTDLAGPGGRNVFFGFGAPPPFGPPDNPAVFGVPSPDNPIGAVVRRSKDREPDEQGQFGLALRQFAPNLNDTEFGFYWTHLHSRLPLLSAQTGSQAGLASGNYASSATYFREFPEDIDKLGVSFNTELGGSGLALQGELTYTIDQPLQIDDVELLFAALTPIDLVSGTPIFGRNQIGSFGFDQYIQGYNEKDVVQYQMTATQSLGPKLGADQLIVLGEVGATYIVDMEDEDELRYEGPGTYTSGNPIFTVAGVQPATETSGFPDDFSAGYRLVARADYNNAIGAVNLRPTIAFAHDVDGTTPAPITNFIEDRKTYTFSLEAIYLENLRGKVSYTIYDGDRHNLLKDRDFVSVTTSYAF